MPIDPDPGGIPFTVSELNRSGLDLVRMTDPGARTSVEVFPGSGAMLVAFRILTSEGEQNLVASYQDLQDLDKGLETTFRGVKLSPYACRIRGGRYRFMDRPYRIEKSRPDKEVLHGLLYDQPFRVEERHAGPGEASVRLGHRYEGTDPGYPFPYTCEVDYRLGGGSRLDVETRITNRSSVPIPVMDGWHPYFQTGTPVDELDLSFPASELIEFDEGLIPTGIQHPFGRFRAPEQIGPLSLDNSFWLDPGNSSPCCRLTDPSRGISLALYPEPSYPVLQLYIPPDRKSIAMEPLSGAPDAFNNGMGLVLISPGEQRIFSFAIQATVCIP